MISRVKGTISEINEETVILEVKGLCYELMIPSGLYTILKKAYTQDEEVTLFTLNFIEAGDRKSYHYPRLIGFTNKIDREFFQLFTTVSGLGFKKGLKSLTLPIREIATAIETKDAATLNRLPGIGRRMAEKVIAELNGKMTKFALSKAERPLTSAEKDRTDLYDDAVEVLMQLQYSRADAEKMIDKALAARNDIDNVEEMINYIFSQITTGKGPVR